MDKFLVWIAFICAVAIVLYLGLAFITLELSVLEWTKPVRALYVFVLGGLGWSLGKFLVKGE